MEIAKEQIGDLKKKLTEAERAKGVAKWARDEAVRAKIEAEFAKTEVDTSKDKVEEKAYDARVADTQAAPKVKSLVYASYTAPRFGMKLSNELRWRFRSTCGRWRRCTILQPSVRPPPPIPRL